VTTVELSKKELPEELNVTTAFFTKALDASNARTVTIVELVPLAVIDAELPACTASISLATVAAEVFVPPPPPVTGLLPSPPPPPQAVNTAASSRPEIVLNNDIFTALFIR
jgi:hypothetical protein